MPPRRRKGDYSLLALLGQNIQAERVRAGITQEKLAEIVDLHPRIVQKIEANPGTIGIFGYSYLEENQDKLKGIAINGAAPSYDAISTFKYPGARPLYIYIKNAHASAIPAVRAYAAEFTKESAFGPNGYLLKAGLISSPTKIRAHSQQAARALAPLNLAALK